VESKLCQCHGLFGNTALIAFGVKGFLWIHWQKAKSRKNTYVLKFGFNWSDEIISLNDAATAICRTLPWIFWNIWNYRRVLLPIPHFFKTEKQILSIVCNAV
jgi:hypothetical protein